MVIKNFQDLINKYLTLMDLVEDELNVEYAKYTEKYGKDDRYVNYTNLGKLQKYMQKLENKYDEIFKLIREYSNTNILNNFKFDVLKEDYIELDKQIKKDFPKLFDDNEMDK